MTMIDPEPEAETSIQNASRKHVLVEAARPAIEAALREKWAGPNRDKCQWWCEQYVQCQCGAADELEEDDSV